MTSLPVTLADVQADRVGDEHQADGDHASEEDGVVGELDDALADAVTINPYLGRDSVEPFLASFLTRVRLGVRRLRSVLRIRECSRTYRELLKRHGSFGTRTSRCV